MNTRKELGTRNIIGERITQARRKSKMLQKDLLAKLQTRGIDISLPALSLLEGQKRPASDIELNALADIFEKSADWFLGRE
ncbi:MAG: XRE family transcriptional regulator [Clostridiales bacterium]|nr:XRE family transcriptional regulator [Clostridiales bacterium]